MFLELFPLVFQAGHQHEAWQEGIALLTRETASAAVHALTDTLPEEATAAPAAISLGGALQAGSLASQAAGTEEGPSNVLIRLINLLVLEVRLGPSAN